MSLLLIRIKIKLLYNICSKSYKCFKQILNLHCYIIQYNEIITNSYRQLDKGTADALCMDSLRNWRLFKCIAITNKNSNILSISNEKISTVMYMYVNDFVLDNQQMHSRQCVQVKNRRFCPFFPMSSTRTVKNLCPEFQNYR